MQIPCVLVKATFTIQLYFLFESNAYVVPIIISYRQRNANLGKQYYFCCDATLQNQVIEEGWQSKLIKNNIFLFSFD